MKDCVGQDAVRAWLVIATIFVVIGVVGLLGDWDGVTRSAIIGGSIALMAGLLAIATTALGFTRR